MTLVRLFAVGILAHEALLICVEGRRYLTDTFLPAFGVGLGPRSRCAAHAVVVASCVALFVRPGEPLLAISLLVSLSLVIASYSLRLSNHLVIAWTLSLLLVLDPLFRAGADRPSAFLVLGTQIVVVLSYTLACFHKLNSEFLTAERSCAAGLGRLYLEDREIGGERLKRCFSAFAIYETLALEAAIPILLLGPQTRAVGICAAVLFQFQLGLLCHVHFSALMYAGLAAFVPSSSWHELADSIGRLGWFGMLALAAVGAALGWRFGISSICRHPRAGRALQILFGIYSAAAFLAAVLLVRDGVPAESPFTRLGAGEAALLAVVAALFLLNGIAPYLGLKTEFSMAMFSNLRVDPWRHLIVPAHWRPFQLASYVRVERIEGLPEPGGHDGGWIVELVLAWLRLRTQVQFSSYFFHEGLARVCGSVSPPARVSAVYVERGRRHEVADYARSRIGRRREYVRATLFPFQLPLDPSVPHCA
jgi:hypothetical protein